MATKTYKIDANKVVLSLTKKEHAMLKFALGNSMDFPDVVEALFPNQHDRAAAIRAYERVQCPSFFA